MSSELEYLNEITDAFVRGVYDVLGEDKGKEAIEALKPVMGKAWKDGIILRKLTQQGPVSRRIRFKLKDEYRELPSNQSVMTPKKINAIRALRSMTGLGLVEGKNLIEASYNSWRYCDLTKARDDEPETVSALHRIIQGGMQGLSEAGWLVHYA